MNVNYVINLCTVDAGPQNATKSYATHKQTGIPTAKQVNDLHPSRTLAFIPTGERIIISIKEDQILV